MIDYTSWPDGWDISEITETVGMTTPEKLHLFEIVRLNHIRSGHNQFLERCESPHCFISMKILGLYGLMLTEDDMRVRLGGVRINVNSGHEN